MPKKVGLLFSHVSLALLLLQSSPCCGAAPGGAPGKGPKEAFDPEKERDDLTEKLRAAIQDKDLKAQATLELALGRLLTKCWGDQSYEQALSYLSASVNHFGKLGLSKQQAEALVQLGDLLSNHNEYALAASRYLAAFDHYQKLKQPSFASEACRNAGGCYIYLHRLEEAEKYLNLALKMSREARLPADTATVLLDLAHLYSNFDQFDKALEFYNRCQSEYADHGLLPYDKRVRMLTGMGNAYDRKKRYDLALQYYTACLELQKKSKDPSGVGKTYMNLANIHCAHGHFDKALRIYRDLLRDVAGSGDFKQEAALHQNIAYICDIQKNVPETVKHLQYALQLWQQLGEQLSEAKIHVDLGEIFLDSGAHDLAIQHSTRALAIFEEQHTESNAVRARNLMARIYIKRGRYDAAILLLNKNEKLMDSLQDPLLTAQTLALLGSAYDGLGDPKAIDFYKQSALKFQELGLQSQYLIQLYQQLGGLVRRKRSAEAAVILDRLTKECERDPEACNLVAWFMVTTEDLSLRNPKRALEWARKAVALTAGKKAAYLDTLAEVCHANNLFDEAVAAAEKADALAPGTYLKNLDRLKKARTRGKQIPRSE